MDVPVLPGGRGRSWLGKCGRPRQQFGRNVARYAGDVFRRRLLPDAHRSRRAR